VKRLFVSVDLGGLSDEVRAVQRRLDGADGVRLTDPEQTHVTLKFLGGTDSGRVPEIVSALETAVADSGVGPFDAAVGGLGVFPSIDYISVVWVGVREGSEQLTALHEVIEDRMTAMGFDAEDHDFTPHATIARMNHAGGKKLVQRVVEQSDPEVGRLRASEIRLTESVLGEDGPVYTTVEEVPL